MVFPCKFQPAFNTSPTVAALFLMSSTLFGLSALFVGAVVFAFAPSRLPATFVIELLPKYTPFSANETGFLPVEVAGVIVTPALVSLVVGAFGSVPLNSALVRLVNTGFRL